jgi:hypothetical protein
MRRLLALALVTMAGAGLLGYLPQAMALVEGRVDNSSYYTVTDTDGMVYCRVQRDIELKKGKGVPRTSSIECRSRFPDQVNLQISVQQMQASLASVLSFSPQSIQLNATDANLCRPIDFQVNGNMNGSGRVLFKVVTTGSPNFSAELYFEATVIVNNSSIDGCQ